MVMEAPMAEAAARPWTVEEFVAWETRQAERYEYVNGTITMMVGGTLVHHLLATNLASRLSVALDHTRCFVFGEGPKVAASSSVMYPDVVVACGAIDEKSDILTHPVLVAEVLSPSTGHRDRNIKWNAYQSLPSLQHYLLISQDEVLVEMFTRQDGSWQPVKATGLEAVLTLSALELPLPLAAIYRGTSLAG